MRQKVTKQIHLRFRRKSLNSLQLNCNGISGKAPEIVALLCNYHSHIEVFEEFKLDLKNWTPFLGPNYTLLRKDRLRELGDLFRVIHNSLLYDEIETVEEGILEAQSVNIKANNQNSVSRISVYLITVAVLRTINYQSQLSSQKKKAFYWAMQTRTTDFRPLIYHRTNAGQTVVPKFFNNTPPPHLMITINLDCHVIEIHRQHPLTYHSHLSQFYLILHGKLGPPTNFNEYHHY